MRKLFFSVVILALALLPGALHAAGGRIALLDSLNTSNFMKGHYTRCADKGDLANVRLGGDEYKRYFLGWQYVLEGQPNNALIGLQIDSTDYDFDVITDTWLTDGSLAAFDILILSNNASLDDAQEKAVQQWVLKGGKLIATFGSGYKDVILDSKQDDGLKLQKGGTTGLHNLWHDPMSKAFGTQALNPPPGVRITINNAIGPAGIPGWQDTILSYGAEANLLVSRPEDFKDVRATLLLDPPDVTRRAPLGMLDVKASKGRVVYFAFAPEFIVALAFDLAGHCSGDVSYPAASPDHQPGADVADFPNAFVGDSSQPFPANTDRVRKMMQLMKTTIDYMVAIQ